MPARGAHDLRARRGHDVPEAVLSALLDGRRAAAVFLDRDGTLNVKAPEGAYVARPQDLVLLPGAAHAVARLNRAGIRVVLVTNQRWLAAPGADTAAFGATQARLAELLAPAGARLDATYHCPHERGACDCRKPAPGMLHRAARDLGLDLSACIIVGDAVSDVEAGRAAGSGTVLLTTEPGPQPAADAVVPDLTGAVDLVLG